MILRWTGSLAGAAVLTVATFLGMPALLQVDSPEADEEAIRLHSIYYPRDERVPFWRPVVCEHCNYEGIYVDETAIVLEEGMWSALVSRERVNRPTSPVCFAQHTRFLRHEIYSPQNYVVAISTERSVIVDWAIVTPPGTCHYPWGCGVDRRAVAELVSCLEANYHFGTGVRRITISLGDRTTP